MEAWPELERIAATDTDERIRRLANVMPQPKGAVGSVARKLRRRDVAA